MQQPLLLASTYIAVRTRFIDDFLHFKASVLDGLSATPACELLTVTTDLSRPWRGPLLAAGFDPQRPTAWILEGLLPYLDAAAQLAVKWPHCRHPDPGQ